MPGRLIFLLVLTILIATIIRVIITISCDFVLIAIITARTIDTTSVIP